MQSKKRVRADRAAAGYQPRGSKADRLLPELESVRPFRVRWSVPDPRLRPGHKWTARDIDKLDIAVGSTTVRVIFAGDPGAHGGSGKPAAEDRAAAVPSLSRAPEAASSFTPAMGKISVGSPCRTYVGAACSSLPRQRPPPPEA